MFEIDPDKPNIPALARILSGMGLLCLIGSVIAALLSFSDYSWLNEAYAMGGAVAAFLLALVFFGQAKILELLAVVSARVKSRFAIDGITKTTGAPSLMPTITPGPPAAVRPGIITQPVKERVIHVPDEQAREQGFKVR
jgi:hypothetical protein